MFKGSKEFNLPATEEKILDFWKKYNIFEKSVAKRKATENAQIFNFWEGPPTANGQPGLHHLLARAYKDIIARYKSMRGYYVPRRAGWDTHGLPVEITVEKALGFKSKKDIEKYGIAAFNQKCRESVWQFKEEFEKITERMGYWVDMAHPYITYKKRYIESLWWILAEAWRKKLLFKGHKVVLRCTRCGTALSSHEIAQGYKEATDESVYVRFRLKRGQKIARGLYAGANTSVLSWTTALLALPGNVALAVDEKVKYIALRRGEGKRAEIWIIAKDIYDKPGNFFKDMASPLADKSGQPIIFSGKNLVGLKYEALWDVKRLKNSKSHKIYAADFVTTTDGTGVVQINPMYGEDDYNLARKIGLPQHHTIDQAGCFTAEVPKFGGLYVKAKETEARIFKYLEVNGILVKREQYVHEYPFCWRCGTPLLYYAMDSWFIAMSKLRKELVAMNKKVNWIPETIKKGRFGGWIKEAKDWAISRERYWATPLPVWQCERGHIKVVESLDDLTKNIVQNNRFFIMRHGEAEHNIKNLLAAGPETKNHASSLTKAGVAAAEVAALAMKKNKIDLIFASPYKRAKDTAKIIARATKAKIIEDKRLAEINGGIFNWRTIDEYMGFFDDPIEQFAKAPSDGETLTSVRERVFEFLSEIDDTYSGKRILIVSHGDPLWMVEAAAKNLSNEEAMSLSALNLGEWREIVYKNISFNKVGKIDLHRPFIDAVVLNCAKCKGRKNSPMRRVKDVVDVWFDSGAMPFASTHYPFENKTEIDQKNTGFPADYICEGVDQTRGWFYTLMAIAAVLGKKDVYKNVISLGLINDKFGQKMSKSKGNIVNPWDTINRYGVDAVRWYFFTVNPPGETKNFDEADISKVSRKFFNILYNSYIFSETLNHTPNPIPEHPHPNHVLDRWILSRLSETITEATKRLDQYEIGLSARSIESFVDDLSRWYIRRSRGRDDMVKTLLFAIFEVSKLIAPFAPFFSDALYKSFVSGDKSVHLEDWPDPHAKFLDKMLNKKMEEVRRLAAAALAARAEANIKVRQPLAQLSIKSNEWHLDEELLEVLRDEINVKQVVFDRNLSAAIALDTTISEELRREGLARDLNRAIQSLRQDAGLNPGDKIEVYLEVAADLESAARAEEASLKSNVSAVEFFYKRTDKFDAVSETKIGDREAWIALKKL